MCRMNIYQRLFTKVQKIYANAHKCMAYIHPSLALSYPGDSAYIPAGGTSLLMYLEDLKDKWSDRHVMYVHQPIAYAVSKK